MTYLLVDERDDGVAVVTMHDPDRRNAVNNDMNAELLDTLDRLESGASVNAVVLTGTAPAFSAGGNLDDLADAETHDDLREIYSGFVRVAHSSLPTIAAVNGPAVGAGMNFALACDLIVAGESASFDAGFLRLGIHPGGGHTWRLRARVGLAVTNALVLFGQALSGADAERVGLAWRCVADDELLDVATTIAARAAGYSPELVARTKATIAQMATVTESAESIDAEIDPQRWSMSEAAFIEGIAAMKARIAGS